MAVLQRAITELLHLTQQFLSPWVIRIITFIFHLFSFTATIRMATFTLKIKSKNPKTIEDKILYKMQHDRNPALKIFSDKVQVREFIRSKIGEEPLIRSYGSYETIKNIEREKFPRNFVIKANHGSGGSVICWEGAPLGRKLPNNLANITWQRFFVHPDDLNWTDLQNLTEKWLGLEYFWFSGKLPEWAYIGISPQLLVEEVLTNKNEMALDLKFFMFNGKCEFIQLDIAKFNDHKRNFYQPDWTRIHAEILYPASEIEQIRPKNLDKMLEMAATISSGVDFMRVDLYDSDQGVKFGEITNYPGCGVKTMKPRKISIELARNWHQNY